MPTKVTLVQFDGQDPHEVVLDAVPVAEAAPLTHATFVPRGDTPLLDATGAIIDRATARALQRAAKGEPAEEIIVVTVTDGAENASRHRTLDGIRRLVAEREAAGWTFVFLSAHLDGYGDATAMGYGQGSTQAWAPDATGAAVAFDSLGEATSRRKRQSRTAPAAVAQRDFFAGDKRAEADRLRRTGR